VSSQEPLLKVRNLRKYFPVHSQSLLRRRIAAVKAVDDVCFDLMPGETLGLVGESGCGKTTASRAILRALKPTGGRVLFRSAAGPVDLASLTERALKPLRTQMQMIFQDPFSSLNPRMTIGAIVGEPLKIHGLARRTERTRRIGEMLEMVGLEEEHRTRYPHEFSGGQRQRVGIARALIMRPSLVIADEAVSALDVSVQAQVINLLMDLQKQLNLTMIFVAHDLSVVRHISNRVAVMYGGRIVEIAPTDRIFDDPQHPYTKLLLSSVPDLDPDRPMRFGPGGEVPDPAHLPAGCAFHPRCGECFAPCRDTRPELIAIGGQTHAACHMLDTDVDGSGGR
jgi:oligopeptide/dipeptide ABC transporter ATP-binding protein